MINREKLEKYLIYIKSSFINQLKTKNMMKKTVIMLLLVVTALTSSCSKKKEESATLKVINHTNCSYKVNRGMDGNGDYLGSVAPLETREFKVTDFAESIRIYFVASPINCPN